MFGRVRETRAVELKGASACMAKISNPVRFSKYFCIPEDRLTEIGVLDPTLNVDTKLFIDPLLIPYSAHPEISGLGRSAYVEHFGVVIRLLRASKSKGDVAWRNARRLMEFPEVKWTCLGYGGSTISGSGSGPFTTDGVLNTAKEIVDLGIEDPDLFVAMGLFEDKIGADRISDMATNVILPGLLAFNERILAELNIPTVLQDLILRNGKSYRARLPLNPFERRREPVILVPTDILRALPIAQDWSEVADVASKNAALVHRVNQDIGNIWRLRTLKSKADLKGRVLASKNSFETFMDMIHAVKVHPYDMANDPHGEIAWRRIAEALIAQNPFPSSTAPVLDLEGVIQVTREIIQQFKFLVEDRRLSEELYYGGKPRPEKSAQRIFFAVAYAYCKANNLDITPEADTGNGPVDFKVSAGFEGRVLVEIKLSTNSKLVSGYTRQLETYKKAEETTRGFFVVLNVGRLGNKLRQLYSIGNQDPSRRESAPPIILVDGLKKPSASKL